uniref:Protein TIFY 11f n=2 Tax=Oryza sativa TaxID=4530 RepID=TI11F_ORYSJ|nr:RecName: Full=Protein TIFY 11f; Short=OsTIFY11f; AltName: Full=Jasmonate ZIM domain-containing protein 14; Short=OsJAZ14 [Oryza sativa Japonica Group]AAP53565.1 ZIM motif family protein [Oryza sativa Japonica Group]
MAVSDHHCGGGGRSWRFAVACGVLSRCVKAEAAAAANGRHRHHPTMLLMPGADVEPDVREEAAAAAQLKIMYGGRMLVFDDFFPAGGAVVELVRAAARAGQDVRRAGAARRRVGDSRGLDAGLPVVRKVSLQRFVEKRRRMRVYHILYTDKSSHHVPGPGRYRSWQCRIIIAAVAGAGGFVVACGVLSRCVKAEAAAAAANGRRHHHHHHTTMLLMPGADVEPDVREEAAAAAQLKIMYGGRMLVFDDFFPAGGAVVELVRAAARAGRDDDGARARRRPAGGEEGVAAAVRGEEKSQAARGDGAVHTRHSPPMLPARTPGSGRTDDAAFY